MMHNGLSNAIYLKYKLAEKVEPAAAASTAAAASSWSAAVAQVEALVAMVDRLLVAGVELPARLHTAGSEIESRTLICWMGCIVGGATLRLVQVRRFSPLSSARPRVH